MKKTLFTIMAFGLANSYAQLNIQSGATFVIQSGATVTVQGDVVSQSNIQGAGKLQFKGSSAQNLNMNGNTIDVVMEIDNPQNVSLTGATRLNNQLLFTNGKLQLGNFDFTMSPTATHSGANTARFVVTNGTGVMKKEMTANGSFDFVVGNTTYHPVTANVSGASFSNAFISSRAVAMEHPQKHPRSSDFLEHYWQMNRSGITGGTTSLTGTYDNADVTGTEPPLRSFTWNGAQWAFGTGQDNAANSVAANMSGNNIDLYGMNRFVLVNPKVFLQGAYAGAGLMNDRLRSTAGPQAAGTPPTGNLIPVSDPYRTAEYSSAFSHVNNSIAETILGSVLNYKASPGDDIVDWVFVELRNFTGNTTAPRIQTRSVLLQRDGDLVDIDGVSPVYFKDVDAGNYVLSIRHRNHLGISTNPINGLALGLNSTSFDFSNTGNSANIMGTANTNYLVNDGRNMVWGGNGRATNGITNWAGLFNDKDELFIQVLGSSVTAITNVYSRGDYNLNRNVSWSGLFNDKDFLYIQVLGSSAIVPRNQSLPNN